MRETEHLTGHLGLRIKREKVINESIGYLVGHLIGMTFTNGLRGEVIRHLIGFGMRLGLRIAKMPHCLALTKG